jgi:uncharacterized protein YutE (UPF0331/DUF86 family)
VVKPKTLTSILNSLRNYQAKLSILASYPREEFIQDFTKVESAKHLLQVSIECCLDIAHHIAADEGYRTPQDSYDAFAILNEEGILPDSFMPKLRQMVSFRNRVVHIYWDVDDAILYDILRQNRDDFETFVKHILSLTDEQTKN